MREKLNDFITSVIRKYIINEGVIRKYIINEEVCENGTIITRYTYENDCLYPYYLIDNAIKKTFEFKTIKIVIRKSLFKKKYDLDVSFKDSENNEIYKIYLLQIRKSKKSLKYFEVYKRG